ncbi:MAG: putative prokaryotic signal transducing protein [Phycisphaerales bacterium]|jgi:hypothetical protein|nr:putative prokaryotic signal transducing protein [Phycisphaerales bacterium]
MKKVYTALNEADAVLAKAALEDEGIETMVEPGALSEILGNVVSSDEALPHVWVNDEHFDRAMQVLTDAGFKRPHDAGRTK